MESFGRIKVISNLSDIKYGYNKDGLWLVVDGTPVLAGGKLFDALETSKRLHITTAKLPTLDVFAINNNEPSDAPTVEEQEWVREQLGIKIPVFISCGLDVDLYYPGGKE